EEVHLLPGDALILAVALIPVRLGRDRTPDTARFVCDRAREQADARRSVGCSQFGVSENNRCLPAAPPGQSRVCPLVTLANGKRRTLNAQRPTLQFRLAQLDVERWTLSVGRRTDFSAVRGEHQMRNSVRPPMSLSAAPPGQLPG